VAKPIRAQDICLHLNVSTISRASLSVSREKDQLLGAGSLISRFFAVKGNRGIAVLEVRVVGIRRETENNESRALIRRRVVANCLQRSRLFGRIRVRFCETIIRRQRAICRRLAGKSVGGDRNDDCCAKQPET
jgi:hypothetical protein